jgi:two-component system chemotaxis response regulator CheB
MQHHPMPVVVVSSLAQAGSQVALDALEAGAVDVLAKPNGTMSVGALAGQLAHHVKAAAASVRFRGMMARADRSATGSAAAAAKPAVANEPAAVQPPPPYTGRVDNRQLIVIGASTGGVEALRTVLPNLPAGLPPIAVVQHISPYFSKAVAGRLDSLCSMRVVEAEDGMILERGTCVVAPGDYHLALTWQGEGYKTRLMQTPPVHHCRPSVDVLFRSVAEAGGKYVTAALLTGMGSDGAMGMAALRKAGGRTIAEHEKTCVVYGMPRAAIELGVVDLVLPLPQIAGAIVDGVARKPLAAV